MSREAGFDVADRATRTLFDPLLVRAYRQAGLAAVVAWDAVVDASWAAGHRVRLADAVMPLPYDLGDEERLQATLVEVGLLDGDGLIRASSWEGWFGAAEERRGAARERQAAHRARTRLPRDGDVRVTNGDVTIPTGRQADRQTGRVTPDVDVEPIPICPVHDAPMRPSSGGGWYCSKKTNGSYCKQNAVSVPEEDPYDRAQRVRDEADKTRLEREQERRRRMLAGEEA